MKRPIYILKRLMRLLLVCAIIFCGSSIFSGCKDNNSYDGELLRLHIRAHSNCANDQAVKLRVRDAVNEFIVNNVRKDSFDAAYADVAANLSAISETATGVLAAAGFGYLARARLANEYFPSRMYGDVTVPDGYYDALIIELGDGRGDNWWCVVYPPLCYGDEVKYRSFFAELFAE